MKTILLVEDEQFAREMFKRMIEVDENFQVVDVGDGEPALEILKSQPIDYIFLDFNLPNMGGDTTLKYIMDDPKTKDIPVTMISACLPPEIEELCRKHNVKTIRKTQIPGPNPQSNHLLETLHEHFNS